MPYKKTEYVRIRFYGQVSSKVVYRERSMGTATIERHRDRVETLRGGTRTAAAAGRLPFHSFSASATVVTAEHAVVPLVDVLPAAADRRGARNDRVVFPGDNAPV